MSCCPATPEIVTSQGPIPSSGAQSDMQPGESVDCYVARGGNESGKHDDATDDAPNKIDNNEIAITFSKNRAGVGVPSVNIQFKLTANSTAVAAKWVVENKGGADLAPITFTESGLLAGVFSDTQLGKKFEIMISAFDASNALIDARSYKFSPDKATSTNSIRLQHPLAGAWCKSKFGLRMHPIHHMMKPHTGIDLAMPDRSAGKVVAACDGIVDFADINGSLTSGYGRCVKIKHFTSSGQFLCLTLYAHLASIAVEKGQRVAAGTVVGIEGTSGGSTGIHLHFGLQMPDGRWTDPVPYFAMPIKMASGGSATGSAVPVQGALTKSQVVAKSSSPCPVGKDPVTGQKTTVSSVLDTTSGDAFSKAWYFTMKHEVGEWWMTEPRFTPGNPAAADLDAGKYQTPEQKRQVGFHDFPFNGGFTKFGIAQNPNPKIHVPSLGYAQCMNYAKSEYWNRISPGENRVHVLVFDIAFLHGVGAANSIVTEAGYTMSGLKNIPADQQISACEKINAVAMARIMSSRDVKKFGGWITRTKNRIVYARSVVL